MATGVCVVLLSPSHWLPAASPGSPQRLTPDGPSWNMARVPTPALSSAWWSPETARLLLLWVVGLDGMSLTILSKYCQGSLPPSFPPLRPSGYLEAHAYPLPRPWSLSEQLQKPSSPGPLGGDGSGPCLPFPSPAVAGRIMLSPSEVMTH